MSRAWVARRRRLRAYMRSSARSSASAAVVASCGITTSPNEAVMREAVAVLAQRLDRARISGASSVSAPGSSRQNSSPPRR